MIRMKIRNTYNLVKGLLEQTGDVSVDGVWDVEAFSPTHQVGLIEAFLVAGKRKRESQR